MGVSLVYVLDAKLRVGEVHVGYRRVVVFVIVGCGQVFPLVALAGHGVNG